MEQLKRAATLEPYYAAPVILMALVYDASDMKEEAVVQYNALHQAREPEGPAAGAREDAAGGLEHDGIRPPLRQRPPPHRRSHEDLAQGACLLLVLAAGALRAQARPDSSKADSTPKPLRQRTTYEDMQMFSQVLNQIRVNHPDSVDTHELLMAAVEGMVSAADPHSFVMRYTPMSAEKERAYREGKLYPVPIEFDFIEGAAVVVGTAPGSEAARQDILLGDELIAIDGKAVAAQSPMELDVTLGGPEELHRPADLRAAPH